MSKYYERYEQRYQAAAQAGIETWGHAGNETDLKSALTEWAEIYHLPGKSVAEFACGEGGSGVILASLGCQYTGIDISPTAAKKARDRLQFFDYARVYCMDLTQETPPGPFDAVLDVMGLHMLVVDQDRNRYLQKAWECMRPGAPLLLFKESFREEATETPIDSIEEWNALTGMDYETPQKRQWAGKEIYLPTLPARARTQAGYQTELEQNGFIIDRFSITEVYDGIPFSCAIYAHKP